MQTNRAFGIAFRRIRRGRNLLALDVAVASGYTEGHICKLERGQAGWRGVHVDQLSRAIGIKPSALMRDAAHILEGWNG